MKNVLIKASVLSCLAVFAASVYAQDRDENYWRGRIFQRVREDLDRIQQATPKLSTDEYRLVTTKHDLDQLQGRMEAHRYDQPALDKTIAAVEKVANENTLSPQNRVLLQEDLRRLREFREHHDGYDER